MEIIRIKLQKDLLQKCQEYKTEKSITDESYDEFVESMEVDLPTALDMVFEGLIKDSKTIIGLMWLDKYFKS